MLDGAGGRNGLYNAFLRVKENHGGAGVDGVTVDQFEEKLGSNLDRLAREIEGGTYAPLPLLRILVDKGNGEGRALSIPAVRDRVAQTAVLEIIEPVLEKEFEDCSFGYRKGRSVRQAVDRVRQCHEQGFRWIADADIDSFFDEVDHALLHAKIRRYILKPALQQLIVLWVEGEVWNGVSVRVMKKGIPQGSPISPILANLFLDELDEAMLAKDYRIVRYADDFIILCKTPEKAREALECTETLSEKLSLRLGEEEVTDFDHGFRFLGVTFVRSLVMVPFDKHPKAHKILYYPPPLDMDVYFLKKRKGW